MKIKITKRFLLSLCLMTLTLLCGGNKAWGKDVSLITANYTWKAVNNEVSQTISDVTFSFNGGTTKPTYYNSDGLRPTRNVKLQSHQIKRYQKLYSLILLKTLEI